MTARGPSLDALEVFVGKWSMEARFHGMTVMDDGARVTFEWLPGEQFLVQRWSVPVPEAPDGIAIVGSDPLNEGRYLQHYFDSRGVSRLYRMTLDHNAWTLWRDEADFSPLEFRQRYRAKISGDRQTIAGSWEVSHDGTTWQHDFDLRYQRLSS